MLKVTSICYGLLLYITETQCYLDKTAAALTSQHTLVNMWPWGDYVNFQCKPGYEFKDGTRTRSSYCRRDLTWSPETPQCYSKGQGEGGKEGLGREGVREGGSEGDQVILLLELVDN